MTRYPRSTITSLLALLLAGGVFTDAPSARADEVDVGVDPVEAVVDPGPPPPFLQDEVLGGQHWRFETPGRGPTHVWIPPGYEYRSAGIVLYVHGHIHNADQAWEQHRLAEQFLASGRNALFIVPEAQINRRDTIKWRSLGALIREVRSRTGLARPEGQVVAVGHSGAYKTILQWLDYGPLSRIILLDALYGHEDPFWRWATRAAGETAHKLTIVAVDTLGWTERFLRRYKSAVVRDYVPESPEVLTADDRKATLFYMRSQYDHMEIVTQGMVTPILLRATRLGAIDGQ